MEKLKRLTKADIQYLVNKIQRSWIEMSEEMRVLGTDIGGNPSDPVDFFSNLTELVTEEELITYDYGSTSRTIDHILERFKIEIDKDSYEYKKLCREMAIANKRWAEIEQRRNQADYSDDIDKIFPHPPDTNIEKYLTSGKWPEDSETANVISLKRVVDDYCKQQVQSKKWGYSTVRNHQTKINTMLQVLGDIAVNKITIADIRRLRGVPSSSYQKM